MNIMPITQIQGKTNYHQLASPIFEGEVLLFNGGGGDTLIQQTRDLCRKIFQVQNIEKAHENHNRKQFLLRAAAVQEEINKPFYKSLFANWLESIGIDIHDDLYWDSLGLRISAPVSTHGGGYLSHVPVHRDTWGAGIQSQINWWAPITPISYKRTLAFYPDYWNRKLANNTATWSFKDYLASRNELKHQGKAGPYPSVPRNTEDPLTPPHMVRPKCGELLAFSAAHLHSSVTNCTNRTRFSLEIRTVSAHHVQNGVGAPNVDCATDKPLYQLFSAVSNGTKLKETTKEIAQNTAIAS